MPKFRGSPKISACGVLPWWTLQILLTIKAKTSFITDYDMTLRLSGVIFFLSWFLCF